MSEIVDKAVNYMDKYGHLVRSEIDRARLLQPKLLASDSWGFVVINAKYHLQLTKEIIQNDKSDLEKPKNIENLFIRAIVDLRTVMNYLTDKFNIPIEVQEMMLNPSPENIIKYVYMDEDFCFVMIELDYDN